VVSDSLGLNAGGAGPAAITNSIPATPVFSLRILALVCIVVPLVVYAVVGTFRYQQIRTETEVRLDRALRIAQEHALKVLDTNETVLARVLDVVGDDDAPAIRRRERVLHEQLRAMSRDKPQIQSMWLQGRDGRPLATDRAYPAPDNLNVADRAYFLWHKEKRGGLYLSEPMVGRTTGTHFFDMSRGRYLADGTFEGLVSISLSPGYFERFHSDLVADEPGLAITMLRDDGVIFTRWPPLPNAPSRLAAGSPVMSRILAGKTEGTAHGVSSVDGRERLLTFRKVGGYPVYLGTGMDVLEIRRRWMEEMTWLAAFGLPPLFGLYLVGRIALRRTRDALNSARRLNDETLARRRVEEALLQAQKLEALGRLTGGVAHDFNNALMVISNNLFLLKRKHPQADGAQVESIGRAVQSATKLTRQLLAFSRRQALVPEYVKLQERLPKLQDLLGPVLGSQITLTTEVAADTEPILVDWAEFELALINLAINARDAMPSSGRFDIVARNVGDDMPPMLKGPMVVVEASDSGSGIAPHVLDKVFEPFFTTKPVGEGTGLGLSQVYGLCQRAGGLATIRSQVDEGTSVRLFFPATTERPADAANELQPLDQRLRKTVLLVEDNDEVAAALQPVLEAMGCTVSRLDRATLAKAWLSQQDRLPDVMLTDVVMPGDMDGLALAQHVQSRYPRVKTILMTGYAEQIEAISRQGFEVIPKPCSAEMLAAAIVRVSP
jgi:signal transduction histidine kinase